jgi:DNA-binding helix-turn-helix protein
MDKNDENYVYYLVGQNLKRLRKLKHFTIAKFAMECNYSEGLIMNIESPNYKQTFSLGTIWKFATVLGVDVRDLFKPLDQDD